jgi:pilus assembly protein CpaB
MLNANREQLSSRRTRLSPLIVSVSSLLNKPIFISTIATLRAFWRAPGQFRLPLFLIALGCGIASAYSLVSPFEERPSPAAPQESVEVLVAKRNLQAGEVASRDTLAVRRLPAAYAAEAMLSPERIDEIEGFLLQQHLAAGEPLLRSQIEDTAQRIRHPSLGMRLVQVVVEDRFGLQRLPSPGDHVDLFWQDPPGMHRNSSLGGGGIFLLEDIAVKSIRRLKAEAGSALSRRNSTSGVVQLEVEVIPEHAIQLVRASSNGLLQMTLRHPADRGLLPLAGKPEYPVGRYAPAPFRGDRPKPDAVATGAIASSAAQAVPSAAATPTPSVVRSAVHAPKPSTPRSEDAGDRVTQAQGGLQRSEGSGVEVIRGGQRTMQESVLPSLQGQRTHHTRSDAGLSASGDLRGLTPNPTRQHPEIDATAPRLRSSLEAAGEGDRRDLTELLRGAITPPSAEPRIVR